MAEFAVKVSLPSVGDNSTSDLFKLLPLSAKQNITYVYSAVGHNDETYRLNEGITFTILFNQNIILHSNKLYTIYKTDIIIIEMEIKLETIL